jgi:DNA-binding winged helix-turn-helix (wHTH) protein
MSARSPAPAPAVHPISAWSGPARSPGARAPSPREPAGAHAGRTMRAMCPVCQVRAAEIGVLCLPCRDEIALPIRAAPEQVQRHGEARAAAALVDVWGRPHALAPSTLVGRTVGECGLAVLEVSISRRHAQISLEGGAWSIRDLASANGTYVDDRPVHDAAPLRAGARVRFGQLAFYFLPEGARLSAPHAVEMSTGLLPCVPAVSGGLPAQPELEDEHTDPGLPSIAIRVHEATGGGGGFVELEGRRVQLTPTQLGLISLMARRMASDADQPALVRGFVRSAELIARLPWDTAEPNENHVKQLVRRVRRALMKVALGDLIESRHRLGYRLRAIPRAE